MTDVTISDIGHAMITLDMELDKLATEERELEMRLEHNRARQTIINHAIDSILHCGKYRLNYAGD